MYRFKVEILTNFKKILNNFSLFFYVAIQVDYDLSFPEAGYSSAALSVPFRFDSGRQSFTIAMWVQFTHHDEPGVFFTLYNVAYVFNGFYIFRIYLFFFIY